MANNPLAGAWQLVSDSDVGILIYTGSHYAVAMAPKDRPRSAGEQTTPDEALEALLTCPALSGTYTVSGSRITPLRVDNVRAELSGRPNVVDYAIDGDTMIHSNVSGGRVAGASFTFRKTPSGGPENPLVGAWEMDDDAEQGVIIFTETHYAVVRMHKERELPKGEQYTPEEALTTLYTSGAQAGAYTVFGNTVTMTRTAHLRPERVGDNAVLEVTAEGNTIKTRGVSGITPQEMNWCKVG